MSDRPPFDRPWADRLPGAGQQKDNRVPATDRPAGDSRQSSGAKPAPAGLGGSSPDAGTAPAGVGGSSPDAGSAPTGAPAPSPAAAGPGPVPDSGAVSAQPETADDLATVPGPVAVEDDRGERLQAVPDLTEPDLTETEPTEIEPTGIDPIETDVDADALVAEAEAAISNDLSALSAERDEYLEALRRLQADFENYKKRMLKQQTTTLERAGEDLVVKLLPVLDTVDLARRHGAGEGVEQVATALLDVLAKEGLERLDPAGTPFDPNEHEAVAHEEGEGDPEVIDVLRAGYRWRGRLLRPAMVTVKG